jgi:hypothetical protein
MRVFRRRPPTHDVEAALRSLRPLARDEFVEELVERCGARGRRGRSLRIALLLALTAVFLVPLAAVGQIGTLQSEPIRAVKAVAKPLTAEPRQSLPQSQTLTPAGAQYGPKCKPPKPKPGPPPPPPRPCN